LFLESRIMRKVMLIAATAAALLVAGCNTIEGLGRDVQAAGSAVTGAASDARR
jgi:entericidin B